MLIGTYYHRLEEKGRLSLPKKFRQDSETWVVTRGLDGGLFMFEKDKFAEELSKLSQQLFTKKANRDLLRLMSNEAYEVTCDKTGRVHLPEYLIKFAKLTKQVVVVGSFNKLEVWDQDAYHHYLDTIEPLAEEIAEKINE